ncbi:MAG: GNAT family N-acetyltransferase [Chloroflexi bacterium]|nr:GNAT family N-acetyltransferase [Chloroflexota bacterium]
MTADIIFRLAIRDDLPEIVRMLADDELGRQREDYKLPLPDCYFEAFEMIEGSSFFELIVAELSGHIVGSLQLIYIPSLSYKGGLRAQVESVRVDEHLRGQGIGKCMMEWAIERARQHGAHILQLTTHHTRKDAHRFYERLGFTGSHLGMKLSLKQG